MKILRKLILFIFRVPPTTKKFKHFKALFINFYDCYNTEWQFHSFRITKCRVYDLPKKMIVEIHSLSPGMIIGKSGKCIDALQAHLQKKFSKYVEIKLEETNPFK